MQTSGRLSRFAIRIIAVIAIAAPALAGTPATAARPWWREIAAQIVGIGGYFFTDSSARNALGTPKFSGNLNIYLKVKRFRAYTIDGGFQTFGASDHWQPFSGGNHFSMTGLSFRVQGERRLNHISPYIQAGVYYGDVGSYRQNFSAHRVVPAATIGAEYRFARYWALTARYHANGSVGGVDTSGFAVGLKVF